jgi:hypothetical protein
MTYVYPAKMFFARLFWNRKPLLLFIVIISLMVTGVCFGCGLISGFNYFFVENNTYALYEFLRAVIGIVISSFIFFLITSDQEKDLPEYVIDEAEKILPATDEKQEVFLENLIYVAKESGQIEALKKWMEDYNKLQKINSEIAELTNTRDDATADLFVKTQKKKAVEKELVPS